jgi:hypothetical protein
MIESLPSFNWTRRNKAGYYTFFENTKYRCPESNSFEGV